VEWAGEEDVGKNRKETTKITLFTGFSKRFIVFINKVGEAFLFIK
jgi:hypothetical protein